MTASPRTSGNNPEAQQREAEYAKAIVDLTPAQLLGRMSLPEALHIDEVSLSTSGTDLLRETNVSELALSCRLNKEMYDDDAEDFIFESRPLQELIDLNRKVATHETAEAVRFLRSARAAIYFYDQGVEPEFSQVESGEDENSDDSEDQPNDNRGAA